jgi:hypothetical protein
MPADEVRFGDAELSELAAGLVVAGVLDPSMFDPVTPTISLAGGKKVRPGWTSA